MLSLADCLNPKTFNNLNAHLRPSINWVVLITVIFLVLFMADLNIGSLRTWYCMYLLCSHFWTNDPDPPCMLLSICLSEKKLKKEKKKILSLHHWENLSIVECEKRRKNSAKDNPVDLICVCVWLSCSRFPSISTKIFWLLHPFSNNLKWRNGLFRREMHIFSNTGLTETSLSLFT